MSEMTNVIVLKKQSTQLPPEQRNTYDYQQVGHYLRGITWDAERRAKNIKDTALHQALFALKMHADNVRDMALKKAGYYINTMGEMLPISKVECYFEESQDD